MIEISTTELPHALSMVPRRISTKFLQVWKHLMPVALLSLINVADDPEYVLLDLKK